ncbi:MAG TPA: RNA polymerase sigma factor [Ilumatobacter sp.]|nr:RNA polymerase sigma factor [Ilumatobacter sp.]
MHDPPVSATAAGLRSIGGGSAAADDVVLVSESDRTPGWFDHLYRRHRKDTVRLARLLTGSAAAAEDLAHEAFIRLYRRSQPIDNPVPFLRVVTVNVCRDWHRSQRRERLRAVRVGVDVDHLSLAARELDASLARLPYHERAVIVLRYWLDLSESDIALTLGCRPGTVKSRHARALHKLNKELSQ